VLFGIRKVSQQLQARDVSNDADVCAGCFEGVVFYEGSQIATIPRRAQQGGERVAFASHDTQHTPVLRLND